jgi:hypothetical protein
MARKYSKSETPSLGKNQEWQPTSRPSPFRPHIGSGDSHPPIRNVDADFATRWNDSVKNAKAASRVAKSGKRVPK